MRKKKKAKLFSPNERALRERVRLRDHVRSVAIEIRRTWDWLDRAIEAEEGSDAERFYMEQVKGSWLMVGERTNFGSGAMMRLVADALAGKSLLSKSDEQLLDAYAKATRSGKRRAQRMAGMFNFDGPPFPSEIHDALPASKRKDTVNRKDTTELTAKEKKQIRDLELRGFDRAFIKDVIGKPYKHNEDGEPVAVNENGDAPLAKRTKKRNKEAASRRLKALGRPMSEEPGAPRGKRP